MGRIQSYNGYTVLDENGYTIVQPTGTAVASLGTIPKNSAGQNATSCTITVTANAATTGDAVYVRLDGGDPSATEGLALRDGAVYELFQQELSNARFLSADGETQSIRVEFAIVS